MTEKPLPVFLHITEFYNQDNCISLKKGDELSVLWKKYAALTGICIFLGILAGGLFKGSYFDDLKTVMNSFIDYVINRYLYIGSTEKTFLLIKIIIKRVGTFALLWLLSLTVAKMPYIVWLCIKNGVWFKCRDISSGMGFSSAYFIHTCVCVRNNVYNRKPAKEEKCSYNHTFYSSYCRLYT